MNESGLLIKEIIKYLKDVCDVEKIEGLSQHFFISNRHKTMYGVKNQQVILI